MATFGSIAANNATWGSHLPGTTTPVSDPAAAGEVGQKIEANVTSGSAVSLTTATPANVTSLSLTAGQWLISGHVTFKYGSATQSGDGQVGISVTSATLPGDSYIAYDNTRQTTTTSNVTVTPVTTINASDSGTWTVYLVAQATFSAGTCGAFGNIRAVRIR